MGDENVLIERQHGSGAGFHQCVFARIVDLAKIDARLQDRQKSALPARIGGNDRAFALADNDLGNCTDLVAPAIEDGILGPHQLGAIPAVRQPDLYMVGALFQKTGDVIALEGQALVISGPAGC